MAGVRTAPSARVHYFDAGDLELKVGERAVVETEDGTAEGEVVIAPAQVLFCDLRGPMLHVLRRVSHEGTPRRSYPGSPAPKGR